MSVCKCIDLCGCVCVLAELHSILLYSICVTCNIYCCYARVVGKQECTLPPLPLPTTHTHIHRHRQRGNILCFMTHNKKAQAVDAIQPIDMSV